MMLDVCLYLGVTVFISHLYQSPVSHTLSLSLFVCLCLPPHSVLRVSAGRVVPPSAFVFHESRVGSTLVANNLASSPYSLVFSESAPTANALLHCFACTRQQEVQLFRDIVTLMGRSPIHHHLFFKFQSITSTKMEIALEVS